MQLFPPVQHEHQIRHADLIPEVQLPGQDVILVAEAGDAVPQMNIC